MVTPGAATLLDPDTLRPLDVKQEGDVLGRRGVGAGARASADGRTLDNWRPDRSPEGLRILTFNGRRVHLMYQHDEAGHLAPAPDGRVVYTAMGRYNTGGKPINPRDANRPTGAVVVDYGIPAAEGSGFYLNFTNSRDKVRPLGTVDNPRLAVHDAATGRKVADLPGVEAGPLNIRDREPLPTDQRLVLVPSAKLLVVLPPANDRLLLYPFDPDALLEKAGWGYLVVDAPPAAIAVRGRPFTQPLTIRSKKSGVRVAVESGPAGLTVTPDGTVSWAVPKDFAADEAVVILAVSDESGQKRVQTLRVNIRADRPAGAAAPPK